MKPRLGQDRDSLQRGDKRRFSWPREMLHRLDPTSRKGSSYPALCCSLSSRSLSPLYCRRCIFLCPGSYPPQYETMKAKKKNRKKRDAFDFTGPRSRKSVEKGKRKEEKNE